MNKSMFFVAVCAVSLSGCTTLRGAQDPIADLHAVENATLRKFYSAKNSDRGDLTQFAYRNLIIREHMRGIEDRYDSFVNQLNSGDRGSALAFDLLQLGLAGATGLVKSTAVEELAVASTITAGARASIDKRVFYDRAITSLIAAMDAERAQVIGDITRKRRLPASEYTLDDAFYDMDRLENAGNINRAFSQINRTAEAQRAAAEARLQNISAACDDINADDSELRQEFRLFIEASAANITEAAEAMAVDVTGVADAKPVLRDKFATDYCGNGSKRELLDQLKADAAG